MNTPSKPSPKILEIMGMNEEEYIAHQRAIMDELDRRQAAFERGETPPPSFQVDEAGSANPVVVDE